MKQTVFSTKFSFDGLERLGLFARGLFSTGRGRVVVAHALSERAFPYQHGDSIRPLRGRYNGVDVERQEAIHQGAIQRPGGAFLDDVRAWLDSTKNRGMALGLNHTKAALDRLSLPHQPDHIIHVAGSNGKGTVCALMAGSLSLSGVSNLFFSSPHLVRVEERIRFNGIPIDTSTFDRAVCKVRNASEQKPEIPLTFFEVTYLVAMQCASDAGVEVLILETGLGGRKDATRSGPATVCLVTSISAEHKDVLGSSLPLIAKEKAAIARPGGRLLIRNPTSAAVKAAVLEEANMAGQPSLGESRVPARTQWVEIPSESSVRQEAMILAEALFTAVDLPKEHLLLANKTVRWPARMQHLSVQATGHHPYLLDAAHNPSGLQRILPELEQIIQAACEGEEGGWSLLFGTSPQDDLDAFCAPLLDLCQRYPPHMVVLSEPQGGRYPGVDSQVLAQYPWQCSVQNTIKLPNDAVQTLLQHPPSSVGLVVSLGSLYLQGNLLEALGLDGDGHLSLLAKG